MTEEEILNLRIDEIFGNQVIHALANRGVTTVREFFEMETKVDNISKYDFERLSGMPGLKHSKLGLRGAKKIKDKLEELGLDIQKTRQTFKAKNENGFKVKEGTISEVVGERNPKIVSLNDLELRWLLKSKGIKALYDLPPECFEKDSENLRLIEDCKDRYLDDWRRILQTEKSNIEKAEIEKTIKESAEWYEVLVRYKQKLAATHSFGKGGSSARGTRKDKRDGHQHHAAFEPKGREKI